jgi:flagellar hook-basal body complex protein FliE
MMSGIERVAGALGVAQSTGSGKSEGDKAFAKALEQVWHGLDQNLKEADRAAEAFASGASGNIHEAMILTEKAALSFRLLGAVRNKLLEAYREIMRMQV